MAFAFPVQVDEKGDVIQVLLPVRDRKSRS